MALAIAILVVALLLGGFIFLTIVEKKRGARVLAPLRARLDVYVGGAAHEARKLNGGELSARLRVIAAYIVHECVHAVLIAVRALERLLTQTVRTLREHRFGHPAAPKGEDTSSSVR